MTALDRLPASYFTCDRAEPLGRSDVACAKFRSLVSMSRTKKGDSILSADNDISTESGASKDQSERWDAIWPAGSAFGAIAVMLTFGMSYMTPPKTEDTAARMLNALQATHHLFASNSFELLGLASALAIGALTATTIVGYRSDALMSPFKVDRVRIALLSLIFTGTLLATAPLINMLIFPFVAFNAPESARPLFHQSASTVFSALVSVLILTALASIERAVSYWFLVDRELHDMLREDLQQLSEKARAHLETLGEDPSEHNGFSVAIRVLVMLGLALFITTVITAIVIICGLLETNLSTPALAVFLGSVTILIQVGLVPTAFYLSNPARPQLGLLGAAAAAVITGIFSLAYVVILIYTENTQFTLFWFSAICTIGPAILSVLPVPRYISWQALAKIFHARLLQSQLEAVTRQLAKIPQEDEPKPKSRWFSKFKLLHGADRS